MSKSYFPHVDGLRTLAVIPVVLFHLNSILCPGGYTGVDVFFVISGYLIIGGIIKSLDNSTFSLSDFYKRRFKRIIPAYIAMVSLVTLFGMLVYPYPQLKELGDSAVASALYISNFYYVFNFNTYFSPDIKNNALLNLWSLSVEEQFYLFIPLFFLILFKIKRKFIFPSVMMILFLSLALAIYCQGRPSQQLSFYMLPSRSWEFLVGGALAMIGKPSRDFRLWGSLLAVLGFMLCLFPYVFYVSTTSFPGVTAIPPVMGAALLIRYGFMGITGSLLQSRPFVFIGKISYSFYLLHWPIIVFYRYVLFDNLSWYDYLSAFGLSFVLAYVFWKWIETPFRTKNWSSKFVYSSTAIACSLVVIWGYFLAETNGAKELLHVEANKVEATSLLDYPKEFYSNEEWPVLLDPKGKQDRLEFFGAPGTVPEVMLLGNSHAEHLVPGLGEYLKKRGMSGVRPMSYKHVLTGVDLYNGSENFLFVKNRSLLASSSEMESCLAWLKANPDIKTVVISYFWLTTIDPEKANSKILTERDGCVAKDREERLALNEMGLVRTCKAIQAMGKRVILVEPTPFFPHADPDFTRRKMILNSSETNELTLGQWEDQQGTTRALLGKVAKELDIPLIDLNPLLIEDEVYKTFRGNTFFYYDSHHLTPEGSKYIFDQLGESAFKEAGF